MNENSIGNKRIAKNTILLYMRMFITMGIALYTSRVVLHTLGVDDFGIYNLVGGIVVLFSFLNTAMTSATQRFLNVELGKNAGSNIGRVFSVCMSVHIGVAILVLLLGETIGLWFVNTQLNIPLERMDAANWVYQFSLFATSLQVLRVPYNACIIAHEEMTFYAYLGISEALLKLISVFILIYVVVDKLILYSILMAGSVLIITIAYKIYCKNNFKAISYSLFWDKKMFSEIVSFSGWSLFGSLANVTAQQGVNIVLNIFNGIVVNAAMGIANQISSVVYGFASNFQVAFNPQIVKLHASDDKEGFNNLVFRASKFSYYLLFIIALPLLISCEFVLEVWLGVVPEYTVIFTQLIIIALLVDSISAPLWMSAQAIGNIRNYQLIMSSIIFKSTTILFVTKDRNASVFSYDSTHNFELCLLYWSDILSEYKD